MNKPMQKSISPAYNRRWPVERRQFSYTLHIPERRSGRDRRVSSGAPHVIAFAESNKPDQVLAA